MLRKLITIVTALLIFGTIGLFVYNDLTAGTRTRAMCAKIQQGMTRGSVNQIIESNDFGSSLKETSIAFVVDHRSFGRHACRVEFSEGLVTSVPYDYSN